MCIRDRSSRARFHYKYRRYGGIITDIVFDHFLALNWKNYDNRPLDIFCQDTTNEIIRYKDCLTDPARDQIDQMIKNRSMEQYVDPRFIRRSLVYLSKKLKRKNPLDSGYSQFKTFELTLKRDFFLFFPKLQDFAHSWIQENYHLN